MERLEGQQEGGEVGLASAVRPRADTDLRPPARYQVVMLNDDYTPMDFVVEVLCRFFAKGVEEATVTMLRIHHDGEADCGVYGLDVAETKVARVMDYAVANEYPLRCRLQKMRE